MHFVRNLTPHDISLANEAGEIVRTYPASGEVARVSTTSQVVGELDGFPVKSTTFGEVIGLPEPLEGTTFLVSLLVSSALKGSRNDVVSPLTDATALRKDGQVLAVRGFQRS